MKRVVIVDAKRTPFGRFRGGLASYSPVDLAVRASAAILAQSIDLGCIDQVILGNVLAAGHGMNIARQVAVQLELPITTPAWTINMMCGSGMQAALAAASAIRAGEARAILAGGTESMSQARMLLPRLGKGEATYDTAAVTDSLQCDGLVDSFSQRHMGEQAETLAEVFQISRGMQDEYAERSQRLVACAQQHHRFDDELVAVGSVIADQHPRPENDRAALALLPPVFQADGSVTAGNASGINDGASMVLMAERDFARQQKWPVLAEWLDGVVVGCEPDRMGLGPVAAIRKLLEGTHRTGETGRIWKDIDTLEINEAFAAQTLACLQQLELQLEPISDDRVVTLDGHTMQFNSDGGAIALGHPLSASGARVLGHLAWKIARGTSQSAIGSLCIGGGMGIAAWLAKP